MMGVRLGGMARMRVGRGVGVGELLIVNWELFMGREVLATMADAVAMVVVAGTAVGRRVGSAAAVGVVVRGEVTVGAMVARGGTAVWQVVIKRSSKMPLRAWSFFRMGFTLIRLAG
jgi:hypothetical protein